MKITYLLLLISLPFLSNAQGGLIIENGAQVILNNSPQIVINDGHFKNDGDFAAANSAVHFKGNAATEYAKIGGTSLTEFNTLVIAKNSNDVRLDYDIIVAGDLQMEGGLLILNSSDLHLEGAIINETEMNRITGTQGGAIIKTVSLNMPQASNPGNLGVEITSSADLGTTTIRRSHVPLENEGSYSIYRHYSIAPENNSNLDATLRFHYFDAELGGLLESDLEAWHFDDIEWESYGSEDYNLVNNWVEVSGVPSFHTFALAENMEGALPIELLRFDAMVNERKEVELTWTTLTEINNDYFTVERSRDGIYFEPIATIQGAGNTTGARIYQARDQAPYQGLSYYRLRQTDFDQSYSFSEIRAVNIELNQRFTVYPNPLREVLHVVGDGTIKGKVIVQIADAAGHLKYHKRMELDHQVSTLEINEVADFIAGNYFLTIQTRDKNYTFNLVKVSE